MILKNFEAVLILRILSASLAGFFIGYERENRNKFAGVRTHIIVCMGAAIAMIVSKYGFDDVREFDAARVAAQIVSGIGFLGAGVIFVKNSSVSGLTTAAGIWTTSIIGMAFGSGLYIVGTVSAVFVVAVEFFLYRNDFLNYKTMLYSLVIEIENPKFFNDLDSYILSHKLKTKAYEIEYEREKILINLKYLSRDREEKNKFLSFLSENHNVKNFMFK